MRTLNKETLRSVEKYIVRFQQENGQAPTYRQVQQALNMSSLNQVHRYVKALEREGKITRSDDGSIELLPQFRTEGSTLAYLVGNITCGNPTESIENIEECYALLMYVPSNWSHYST